MKLFWISAMGMLGVLARYGMDIGYASLRGGSLPGSTFIVNVLGCGLAGTIAGILEGRPGVDPWRLALLVGFSGGFTTFSAYSLKIVELCQQGRLAVAFSYLVASPLVGVVATCIGLFLARTLR